MAPDPRRPPEPVDALDIALRVATAVESLGGAYFIGGSLASSLHGEPRATNDIDIVLSLPASLSPRFCEALGPDFELDADQLRRALTRAETTNGFFLPYLTKIDFFGLGHEPFDAVEFARRSAVRIRDSGELLVVKSAEDSILRKLWWFRLGGEVSERQWRDVIEVLRANAGQLDESHLETWAPSLAVGDLLARARHEASAR